ncbi:MAG: PorT family protein [Bacteroidales bacterium]|nr:PorT family protein [Bacteroidales bacterium]
MKKLLILTTFLLCAEWGYAQVNMGFRAGLNAGLFELKNDQLGDFAVTPRLNLLLGVDVDIPFSMVFSVRTGLTMAQKSTEVDGMKSADSTWTVLFRTNYLELPLLLVARAETDFGNFFIGAGPTFSLGVGGTANILSKRNPDDMLMESTQKIKWNGKYDDNTQFRENLIHFKRFDIGLGAILAYQLPGSGITFSLNYNKGFRELSPDPDSELKTSYICLSFGFLMQ